MVAPEPAVRGRATAASLNHEFRSERWAELYTKKIDDTIAAMKSRGVPVFWVGLPSVRGPKSTSDMQYLNELYRGRAEKAGIIHAGIGKRSFEPTKLRENAAALIEALVKLKRHFASQGVRKDAVL